MEIIFPKEPKEPIETDPKFLIMFSHPGQGKTTALSLLPNNLILDLQHGADTVGGLVLDASSYEKLLDIKQAFINQDIKYDFISIDTATELEEYSEVLAAKLYQDTPMGKYWGRPDDHGKIPIEENNIKKLPQGGGYGYIREAFQRIINAFIPFARYGIILSGHTKDKLINDISRELDAAKLDLTGKLGRIICSKADAVGYCYRQSNEFIINFDSNDIIVKARSKHIRGKRLTLTEYNPDNDIFTHHWDLIYPEYFKQLREKK